MTGRDVEQRFVDILTAVKASVPIPVALKTGPFFSAFGNMARRLDEAGADALVLFNRFYQPDFDLDRLEVVPNLELSTPSEIRLPLLWIAVLAGRIKASLAATTGVRSGVEVVKYLLAGADAVMSTSAVLDHGPAHLGPSTPPSGSTTSKPRSSTSMSIVSTIRSSTPRPIAFNMIPPPRSSSTITSRLRSRRPARCSS